MGKILTFYIRSDKSIEIKKMKYKENKLILDKDTEILFKPENIFLWKRSKLLPPRPCLILQEGKMEPEKLREPVTANPGLFPPLTYSELSELIKRLIARARMKIKPISLNLFIILLLLHVIQIVMIIMVMRGVRIA